MKRTTVLATLGVLPFLAGSRARAKTSVAAETRIQASFDSLYVHISGEMTAVRGESTEGRGVEGVGHVKGGVVGESDTGNGVSGVNYKSGQDGGAGVVGVGHRAGQFAGNVGVNGTFAVHGGIKAFRIDHPLDPENKYLIHASVESPEMTNMYSGSVRLDERGEATVHLPQWFDALNANCRYQLTAIGVPAPRLHVAERIAANRFRIAGGAPGMEVCWQVCAARRDAWARAHPLQVEELKPRAERGTFINPELFGAIEERGLAWVECPDLMRQWKERRTQVAADSKPEV